MSRHLFALPALMLFASLAPASHAPDRKTAPPATTRKSISQETFQPILKRSCVRCHGSRKQGGSLRLDSGEFARRGGDRGAIFKPRDSFNSLLIRLVASADLKSRMPPEGNDPLSAVEVGLLRAWIDQGANWPTDSAVVVGPKGAKHWAFQPIRRPDLPTVADKTWLRNGIDSFVLARLEKEKIAPSPEADRVTLMRRVCLDLLGLPPSPEEVEAYLEDKEPDAYERLVDRLLASPHYGERWGRHWLDLARYADSDGFEKDTGRPFAWRYRHYVIAALNRNVPYDQFVIEQLAGDLLKGGVTEQKVATGFHRNTLTNLEGGIDKEQYRVEAVVDRANTTARVFLGLTLGCAQCHDHKYDPLSQREYYQFFAFFNSDVEVNISAPVISFKQAPFDDNLLSPSKREQLTSLLEQQRIYLLTYVPDQLRRLEGLPLAKKLALPKIGDVSGIAVRRILAIEPEARTAEQKKLLEKYIERGFQKLDPQYRPIVQQIDCRAPQEQHVHRAGTGDGAGTVPFDSRDDPRRLSPSWYPGRAGDARRAAADDFQDTQPAGPGELDC